MDCSLPGSFCPWDFPGKNIGVGCHWGSCPVSHQGSPYFTLCLLVLWVAKNYGIIGCMHVFVLCVYVHGVYMYICMCVYVAHIYLYVYIYIFYQEIYLPNIPVYQYSIIHLISVYEILVFLAFFSYSVQFNCSVVSNFLWLHGLQHARLPCPFLFSY